MKKHYQLLALTTLSVAVLGTAAVAQPSFSAQADVTVASSTQDKKVIVNSAKWVVEGKEPQYHISLTLPDGLNGSVIGKTVDNQTGEVVNNVFFYRYPEYNDDIAKVRPGMFHVEQNPSHTYTLTISSEDGAFSQDIFIPAYDGNANGTQTSTSTTSASTSTSTSSTTTPSTPQSSSSQTESSESSSTSASNDVKPPVEVASSSSSDTSHSSGQSQTETKTESTDSKTSSSTQTTSSTSPVQKETPTKRSLPSTGEVASSALVVLGAGLVAVAAWFGVKKKKG